MIQNPHKLLKKYYMALYYILKGAK